MGFSRHKRQLPSRAIPAQLARHGAQLALLGFLAWAAPARADWAVNGSGACPLASLPRRFADVNAACCNQTGTPGCEDRGMPRGCNIDCAATYIPFYESCSPVLDALFDGSDGTEDGRVKTLDGFFTTCSSRDTADVVDVIETMERQNCAVATAEIVASATDSTDAGGGRRLQMGYAGMQACSYATFDARLAAVDDACCTSNDVCDGGILRTCDFECATVWPAFDRECHMIMAGAGMTGPAYDVLTETCGSLPVLPMMRSIVETLGRCDCDAPPALQVSASLLCAVRPPAYAISRAPVYDWVDITSSGTLIANSDWTSGGTNSWADDDGWLEVALPFDFPFNGNTASGNTMSIGTNGYLTFGTGHFPYGNSYELPHVTTLGGVAVDGMLAVLWTDLNPQASPDGCGVWYQVEDTRVIVSYLCVPYWTGNNAPDPNNSFQVILYPDGTIHMNYLDLAESGPGHGTPSIGIETGEGHSGVSLGYGWDEMPPDGTALEIVPQNCEIIDEGHSATDCSSSGTQQEEEGLVWLQNPIDEPSCPIETFEDRLATVNAACCGSGSAPCEEGPPKTCGLE
eukprot:SAG22_NODE_1587_length_4052_cov_14.409562_2_plen_572_part_00